MAPSKADCPTPSASQDACSSITRRERKCASSPFWLRVVLTAALPSLSQLPRLRAGPTAVIRELTPWVFRRLRRGLVPLRPDRLSSTSQASSLYHMTLEKHLQALQPSLCLHCPPQRQLQRCRQRCSKPWIFSKRSVCAA